jgi:hypothetical protein
MIFTFTGTVSGRAEFRDETGFRYSKSPAQICEALGRLDGRAFPHHLRELLAAQTALDADTDAMLRRRSRRTLTQVGAAL